MDRRTFNVTIFPKPGAEIIWNSKEVRSYTPYDAAKSVVLWNSGRNLLDPGTKLGENTWWFISQQSLETAFGVLVIEVRDESN